MSNSSSSYALLHDLANRRAEKHAYIDLLFSGFESTENDSLLSLVRSSGLSPRGRTVDSSDSLMAALADRNWDMLICTEDTDSALSPELIATLLRNQGRDLPIIQFAEQADAEAQLQAIRTGVTHLIEKGAKQLLVTHVLREYQLLTGRRRLHQLEIALEQTEHLTTHLVHHSNLAIAEIDNGKIVATNPSFLSLFSFDDISDQPSLDQLSSGEHLAKLKLLVSQGLSHSETSIEFHTQTGGSFHARVELIEVSLPNKRQQQLHIDPYGSLLDDKEQPFAKIPDQAKMLHAIKDTAQAAFSGGHDAHLFFLSLGNLDADENSPTPFSLSKVDLHKVIKLLNAETNARLVAHLDSLNFALLFDYSSEDVAKQMAEQIERRLNTLVLPSLLKRYISIGITSVNTNAPKPADLLARAREAALQANHSDIHANFYRDPETRQIEIDSASQQLGEAIRERRLKLMYQPLVQLNEDSQEQNFEILVRMVDNQDRELIPAQFMQSLEHANVMVRLDRWVVENALHAIKLDIERSGNRKLFINIARRTLRSKSFTPWLATQLADLELRGSLLTFALSETDAAADIDYAKVFTKAIRRIGASICIKHFGCSTNSNRVFKLIQPEYIKLDGSFIEELNIGLVSQSDIDELLKPARNGKTQVIAPLIEEISQLGDLYRIGIHMVQGYYLQPPQASMDYEYFG